MRINKRSIGACILLSIVTLGIYRIYWMYLLVKNTRSIQENNNSCVGEMLCLLFVPFYSLYWWYTRGEMTQRVFSGYKFTAVGGGLAYLLLGIFGFDIVSMAIMQHDFNSLQFCDEDQQDVRFSSWFKKYIIDTFPKWKAWIYLSPALVLLLIFTGWPIVNTVRIAFLNGYGAMSDIGGEVFSFGVQNFVNVVQYHAFVTCLKNTVLLCVLTVPISTFLALLIAVCLNSIKFLQRFLQTIFFLPYVTNSIAIGMVFAAMFNVVGNFYVGRDPVIITPGIINNVIQFFGGDPINWMNAGSTYWANMVVMVVYIVWNALPFKILVLLGGLQGINKQYYDAAKVDGTSRIRTFGRITVPLLSPMLAYVIITGFIGGFKEYSSIVGIFGEDMGPAGAPGRLNTMVGYIYDAIEKNAEGTASAAALILFGIILVVTMINLWVSKKKVHY